MSPTNGGSSWETARPIFARGQNDQTNGNQIVALGNGDLANVNGVHERPSGTRSRSFPQFRLLQFGVATSVPLVLKPASQVRPLDNYRGPGAFS